MNQKLFNKIDHILRGKSLVLMYHSIASPESDVWDLAVSPERFEQQLQVLRKRTKIVPLAEFFDTSFSFRHKVAVTFDDGYMNNYLVAKPLLEKYAIPATFFVTSCEINYQETYWWDELEDLILLGEELPEVFKMFIRQEELVICLGDEKHLTERMRLLHSNWKAYKDDPPTRRSKLFYEIWRRLQLLPLADQQYYLKRIRSWARLSHTERPINQIMTPDQLKEISLNSLFTIGSHTANHPALAYHSTVFQKKEIYLNRKYLEETIKKEVNFLAYPYGNYNKITLMIVQELGFDAAFTTKETTWQGGSASSAIETGRFQVRNMDGRAFENQLNSWLG